VNIESMKPGDTRVIDGVEYACVPLPSGNANAYRRARELIDPAGGYGICCQCPYLRAPCKLGLNHGTVAPCGGVRSSRIIVRLDTAAVLALEGVTA
jgi:hypothetical protein